MALYCSRRGGLWQILARGVTAVVILGACACVGSGIDEPEPLEINGAWQYRWGDSPRDADGRLVWLAEDAGWEPLGQLRFPPGQIPLGRVWLRAPVPAGPWRTPALKLGAIVGHFEAYLDGELLLRNGNLDGGTSLPEFRAWHVVPLAPGRNTGMLAVRVHSTFWYTGIAGSVQVGDRADLLARIAQRDAFQFFIGCGLLFAALLLLLSAYRPAQRAMVLYLALFAVTSGAYTVHYTQLKDLLVALPVSWTDVWMASVSLSAIGILGFFEAVFGPGRWRLVAKLRWAHVGLFAALVVASYLFGYRSPWFSVEPPEPALFTAFAIGTVIRLLLVIQSVALIARAVAAMRARDPDARIFLVSLGLMFAFVVRDLLGAFGIIRWDWSTMLPAGYLVFVIGLTLIVLRRYGEQLRSYERKLVLADTEKQTILRDLHDGLGGIATSIYLLAESGRAKDAGTNDALLESISQLSQEGLVEIRNFMHSFDDNDFSWDALAAELRRMGSQMTEPHGVQLQFESDISSAPAPSGAQVLNILRIYREAMTNIIKHAGAGRVSVALDVRDQALELSVADDGEGNGGGGGVDSGRGLRNMQQRAAEIGGELRKAPTDRGTRVRLVANLSQSSLGGVRA